MEKKSDSQKKEKSEPVSQKNEKSEPASQKKDKSEPASQKKDKSEPASQKKNKSEPASQKKDSEPASQRKDDSEPVSQKKEKSEPASQKKDKSEPASQKKDKSEPDSQKKDKSEPDSQKKNKSEPASQNKDSEPASQKKEKSEPASQKINKPEPASQKKDSESAPKHENLERPGADDQDNIQDKPSFTYVRAKHPVRIRLSRQSTFDTFSPKALVNAGFASMGLGMFSIFRPTPFLIFSLAQRLKKTNQSVEFFKMVIMVATVFWFSVIAVILMVFGALLTFAMHRIKRSVLMIHPWGLLLLYFDVFVWLGLTILLHYEINENNLKGSEYFYGIDHPFVFFSTIYTEIFLFFVGFYTYATYFIAAELTVIENFF